MKRPGYYMLFVCCVATLPGWSQNRPTGRPFTTRSEVFACKGMAATSQPLATEVAVDILKRGGSAVDAAIAANAMLGLVEPVSCGIGGDLFALVWDPESGRLHGLNASGRSPRRLEPEEFRRRGLARVPAFGGLAVSVPGCVDGWFELHGKFGRLPMAALLAPAIQYAREGFPVSEIIADAWARSVPTYLQYPGFRETYLIGGRPPSKGDVFRNVYLAETLEQIAGGGRDRFYGGDVARRIAAAVRRLDGFLDEEDLQNHTSTWVDPVTTNYRGYDVWELPPNGQGIAVLQMLNILEGFDLRTSGFGSREHLHVLLETKKLVYEDRAKYYGDPEFTSIPITTLISKGYAAKRRALIDLHRAADGVEAGNPHLRDGDTIYLSVADSSGMMVSLIQSNYRGMGSGVIPDSLGFMIQNRGELFTLEEGHPNAYAPGKRPFHTIIPAFVTRDGKPLMSFGVMGGEFQPMGQVQILLNLIDFGMNLQEAGDAPRISHSGSSDPTGGRRQGGGMISLESGFQPDVLRALARSGHRIGESRGAYGGYQAVMYDADRRVYVGASESRKDGQAAGY